MHAIGLQAGGFEALARCLPTPGGHVAPQAEVSFWDASGSRKKFHLISSGLQPFLRRLAAQQASPPRGCRCSTLSWAWALAPASAPDHCYCMPALPRVHTRCGSSFVSEWPGAAPAVVGLPRQPQPRREPRHRCLAGSMRSAGLPA